MKYSKYLWTSYVYGPPGLFGLWLGCFYLSGAAGVAVGGFGSRAGAGGKTAGGRLEEDEEGDDSVCTEEGSVVTLPSSHPHVMTLIKK